MGRILLIAGAAVAGVLVVALVGVNLYVQAHGTQARIQEELSERLGTTLRIQQISVTPWFGLKLTGITIPQPGNNVAAEFLQADTFRLRVALPSLFSGRLVIKEVVLINPTVVWPQNADGEWRIPPRQGAPAQTAALAPPAAPQQTAAAIAPPAARAAATLSRPSTSREVFKPEVRRVGVRDATFRFLDQNSRPVAVFEDVNFRSHFRSADDLRGQVSVARTSLRDRFVLKQLKSDLTYAPDSLKLTRITARAGDGRIEGNFRVQPGTPESPFEADVEFAAVEANEIIVQAGGPDGMVRGQLEGRLNAAGRTSDPNALAGSGEIFLRNGEVRGYSVLMALGQLLRIDELARLKLEDAHVRFRISPGVITVDEMLLKSPNMRLAATGTVGFDGELQLRSRLAINERVQRQLFRAIRDNFQATEESGFTAVEFKITGTLDQPRTNLVDKLVGPELKDLGGIINSLLGRGSARPKKPKKPQQAAAPDTVDAASAERETLAEEPAAEPPPAEEPERSPTP